MLKMHCILLLRRVQFFLVNIYEPYLGFFLIKMGNLTFLAASLVVGFLDRFHSKYYYLQVIFFKRVMFWNLWPYCNLMLCVLCHVIWLFSSPLPTDVFSTPSPPMYSVPPPHRCLMVFVLLDLKFSVYCFVGHCLSFHLFVSFGHCIVLYVLLWFTASDYLFGVFTLFLSWTVFFQCYLLYCNLIFSISP